MTTSRDPDRLFASWMAEGPETLRDDVLAGVSVEVRRTSQQRGLRSRWARLPTLLRSATMAVGAVAVVAIAVGVVGGWLGATGTGPSVGGPGPAVSASPTATGWATGTPVPSRAPVTTWTIESGEYGYAWPFPGDAVSMMPTAATVPFNGVTPCIVQDPCTDWIGLKGEPGTADRLVWAFGTRTDLGLAAFAADMRRQMSEWRGCPVEPDVTRDIVLDGVPARLGAFTCPSGGITDRHVRVFAVRDGQGLVISMAKPGSGEALVFDDEIDRLLGYLAAFRWAP
jgi:hypothetical protein